MMRIFVVEAGGVGPYQAGDWLVIDETVAPVDGDVVRVDLEDGTAVIAEWYPGMPSVIGVVVRRLD